MTKQLLLLTTLAFSLGAQAECVPNQPEIGDIGPDSESVCRTLQRLYPGSELREEGRTILSASEIVVKASVDGESISLGYLLSGFSWRLQQSDARLANIAESADVREID